jgi:ferritin
MPTYRFRHLETGEEFEKTMKISEFVEYRDAHPELTTVITKAPALGDSMRLGIRKTDGEFNSLLKHIKKGNSKGISDSTIQTR